MCSMNQNQTVKVLHVTYDMRIGGTEQVIVNLIKGSDADLIDMSILCIESPLGPFADDLIAAGIKITALTRKPGFDTGLISQIRQHIKHNEIDIVHCHQYTPYVYGVLGALFSKAKVIFTEHGRFYPDSSSWKRKLINPLLNKLTSSCTAISQATRQALVEFENIPEKSIDVIYNGITPLVIDSHQQATLAKQLNIPSNTLCIGTIARLDPIKNHTMMLKAFKRVLESGVKAKLMIVGDGEEKNTLLNLIEELAIEEHVIMTGYEPKPQNHLALMDIYLLPSLSEGTSMTLLEAMSIGKPCIVTHAGGNPEIVLDQQTGFVTPNNDELAYAQAIIELSAQPDTQRKFGQAAQQRFENIFSAKQMAKSYEKLYLQ